MPFRCTGEKPQPLTADAVPHLVAARRNGEIEVALHGYCHRELARLAGGNSTEFSGIQADRQREAITCGKARLEEAFSGPVSEFVPPWNSYDRTTLELINELGFGYLSADWALVGEAVPPIPVLPHTCNLVHLEEAVTDARQFPRLEPIVVVILHHFDFAECGGGPASTDIPGLQRSLHWVTEQPDLRCTTLADLATGVGAEMCAQICAWRAGVAAFIGVCSNASHATPCSKVNAGKTGGGVGTTCLRRLPQALKA